MQSDSSAYEFIGAHFLSLLLRDGRRRPSITSTIRRDDTRPNFKLQQMAQDLLSVQLSFDNRPERQMEHGASSGVIYCRMVASS